MGRKPCKLCHTRSDSLLQAVFTFPASIHHRFFCKQDCLEVRFPHHIVNEDDPILYATPFRGVADVSCDWLVGENVRLAVSQLLLDQRTKGERIAVLLNPYMVDVIMGENMYDGEYGAQAKPNTQKPQANSHTNKTQNTPQNNIHNKQTIASIEVKLESETVLTRSVLLLHHIVQYLPIKQYTVTHTKACLIR